MQLIYVAIAMLASSVSALESFGVENCPNKCDKVFDRTQYAITNQPGENTFEFRSCILGCNRCARELKNSRPMNDGGCFEYCKNLNYGARGIRKGVIEPDKACIVGCLINTCQEVCTGGTTDHAVTTSNQQFWWGLGGNGCSIKSGLGYVQSPLYGNPTGGQGASEAQKQCCTNAFNLCNYNGDKSTTNYANVVLVSARSCRAFVPSGTTDDICAFYNNPQMCGVQGMPL